MVQVGDTGSYIYRSDSRSAPSPRNATVIKVYDGSVCDIKVQYITQDKIDDPIVKGIIPSDDPARLYAFILSRKSTSSLSAPTIATGAVPAELASKLNALSSMVETLKIQNEDYRTIAASLGDDLKASRVAIADLQIKVRILEEKAIPPAPAVTSPSTTPPVAS